MTKKSKDQAAEELRQAKKRKQAVIDAAVWYVSLDVFDGPDEPEIELGAAYEDARERLTEAVEAYDPSGKLRAVFADKERSGDVDADDDDE